ncbi:MAG: hypothetical protein ACM3N6_08655 [Betaproteobacteria bacterium]
MTVAIPAGVASVDVDRPEGRTSRRMVRVTLIACNGSRGAPDAAHGQSLMQAAVSPGQSCRIRLSALDGPVVRLPERQA